MPFDKSKIPKDDDLLNFNSVIEEDDGEELEKEVQKTIERSNKISRDDPTKSSNKSNKVIIIICLCVLLSVSLIIGGLLLANKSKERDTLRELEEYRLRQEEQARNNAVATSTVAAGAPDVYANSTKENDTPIINPNKITHGLNGEEVDAKFKISKITTVRDFINYEKFRSTTAEGLEFYWLEVEYKGKPYKVQTPYKIFKELEDSGVTLADVEVTYTDSGVQIITYMNVVENAKSIINKK